MSVLTMLKTIAESHKQGIRENYCPICDYFTPLHDSGCELMAEIEQHEKKIRNPNHLLEWKGRKLQDMDRRELMDALQEALARE